MWSVRSREGVRWFESFMSSNYHEHLPTHSVIIAFIQYIPSFLIYKHYVSQSMYMECLITFICDFGLLYGFAGIGKRKKGNGMYFFGCVCVCVTEGPYCNYLIYFHR